MSGRTEGGVKERDAPFPQTRLQLDLVHPRFRRRRWHLAVHDRRYVAAQEVQRADRWLDLWRDASIVAGRFQHTAILLQGKGKERLEGQRLELAEQALAWADEPADAFDGPFVGLTQMEGRRQCQTALAPIFQLDDAWMAKVMRLVAA